MSKDVFAGIQRGDEEAWGQLYDEKFAGMVQYAKSRGISDLWSEDIAQEAMIALWKNAKGVDMTRNPDAYLRSATRSKVVDLKRHELHRTATAELSDFLPSRDTPVDVLVEMRQGIDYTLAQVPERYQSLLLEQASGFTVAETAERHGMNPNTVKTRMFKIRQELKAMQQ